MSAHAAAPRTQRGMRRNITVAIAGSAIEWYDFFIYATASALVLNKLFFPTYSETAGTLLALSTFAVGFVVRPFGAALFGHFGDRLGRRPTLVAAMMLMGLATVAIGLLPTYATIGSAAPVILVLLRLIQGLALGGQWGGAVLVVTETAPEGRRGFYGSFAQLGVPVALILSNLIFLALSAWLSADAFLSWGWRIPFLASVLMVGVGIYAQSRLEETLPAANGSEAPPKVPLAALLSKHWRETLLAAGVTLLNAASYYVLSVYVLAHFTKVLGHDRNTILLAVITAAVVSLFTLPAAAAISDRIGRARTYAIGAIGLAIWFFPTFWLLDGGSLAAALVALVVAQVVFSFTYGPSPALFCEMFGDDVRYTGVSLGYQIGAVVGGAFAPIIATALYAKYGTSNAIALYLAVVAAISLASVVIACRRLQPVSERHVALIDAAVARD
jgi:MHS family shikimate/dehydroshikimate transporter-like MFS transporter